LKRIDIEQTIAGKTYSEILSMKRWTRCKWYKTISQEKKEEAMKIVDIVKRANMTGKNNPTKRPEVRSKLSAIRGEKHHHFGESPSEEIRAKQRAAWTPEMKAKQRAANTGKNNPMYGVVPTEEHRNKISMSNKGKIHTEEHRQKISAANQGILYDVWNGYVSFEPYGVEFNDKLKEQIRQRDNYICQECGKTQEELGRKLDVHHIDYDKKNNDPNNLICLCHSCHMKTNHNREYWTEHFRRKINGAD